MKAFEVGGAVRDRLRGEEPEDIDFVVVGATPEEMLERGFKQVHVGNNEQVVFLDCEGHIHPREEGEEAAEVALARREVSTGEGFNDFEFETEGVSLEEDLHRRDLTINAMARDPETGVIIDPFGGLDDLEDGIARHVSEKFAEDPVRVLRLARFVARMDLRVAPETREIAREVAPRIRNEPVERVRDEMLKAFKQAESPRRFFDTLRDVNALEHAFPLLDDAIGIGAGGKSGGHHQEGDLFTHTMLTLEQAHRIRPNDARVLLAALTHDLGKVKTATDEHPDSRMHDKHDDFVVERFATRLRLTNEHEAVVRDAVTQHMRFHTFAGEMGDSKKVMLVDRHTGDRKGLTLDELVDLCEADSLGRLPQNDFDRRAFEDEIDRVRRVVEEIGGHFVIDMHGWKNDDGEIEKPGEVIGETIHQDRVRALRGNLDDHQL